MSTVILFMVYAIITNNSFGGNMRHGPSFLRWAGSKRKSLSSLSELYIDEDLEYIEPFAGSAALFFDLAPKRGTLADLNPHLINAMRQISCSASKLYDTLLTIPRNKSSYYQIRERFNNGSKTGFESAVLFVFLNRNCFNGLWRTNKLGKFNVPYGGEKMGKYPPLELFELCGKKLEGISLRHQDFRKTVRSAGYNSFIYADPPYFTASERTFIEYGQKSFGKEDLFDLVESLKQAETNGAKIVLTYSKAMPDGIIPSNWSRHNLTVVRNVGGFSSSRKKQVETIFTNVT